MASLRTNIIASYAGQAWMALMAIAFVPVYIRVLGIEAFGLVGFMLSLQAISQILDFGIGGAISRELARRSHRPEAHGGIRDLVRTFEAIVWPMAILLGGVIWLASPVIADSWLNPQQLGVGETAQAIAMMAAAIAMLWPTNFYTSGLSGLEKQTELNLANAIFATLRGAGVLPILYWISPSITAFFSWYALMGLCQSLTLAVLLWRAMPTGRNARVRFSELMRIRQFAGGLFAITALSLCSTQFDRVALSALRPLEELGYYAVAMSIAAGLGRMVLPMFNALYPRFSRLVASGSHDQLANLYHLSNQCLAVVVFSVAFVLAVFGEDVLYLWTGDGQLAAVVAMPLLLLVLGSALNGLMNLPYALQLAHGWTSLAVVANAAALCLAIPFGLWAISRFGMAGAASVWFAINLGYVAIVLPLMHRRILPGTLGTWYSRDMLPPFLAAAAVTMVARLLFPSLARDPAGFATLFAISAATLMAAAIASPATRHYGRKLLSNAAAT